MCSKYHLPKCHKKAILFDNICQTSSIVVHEAAAIGASNKSKRNFDKAPLVVGVCA